ncbi:MAG: extracellular solute-binding protein [Oscillospiraceae bacterium]|nr:extracellular solute-binding protein [Oscillospiraceae bacterium]
MRKLVLSVLLVTVLVVSLFAGCGGNNNQGTDAAPAPSSNNNQTSTPAAPAGEPPVDLVYYTPGDPRADYPTVEAAFNEYLLEKLNTTVTFEFSTWTDAMQKMQTKLTAGGADLMYAASWWGYPALARAQAFHELDDLLPQHIPTLYSMIDQGAWNAMRIDGNIYAIPNLWPEYVSLGISYREDLRAQFNLPKPDSFENMEALLMGYRENMPEQTLIVREHADAMSWSLAFTGMGALEMKYPWTIQAYGLAATHHDPSQVVNYWASDDFVEDMYTMKRWADAGFWSRGALSDTSLHETDTYGTGMTVALIGGQNPNKQVTYKVLFEETQPGWINEYIAYGEVTGAAFPAHPTQNCTVFPRSSGKTEQALKVVELVMTDPVAHALIHNGIEGLHYEMRDGFWVGLPEGENLNDYFPYEGNNTWNLRREEFMLLREADVYRNAFMERLDAVSLTTKYPRVNIGQGFAEDYESYEAERIALRGIMTEYLGPIQAGFVDNIEGSIADFLQRAENVGLSKIQDEWTKQWLAYCNEFGYV